MMHKYAPVYMKRGHLIALYLENTVLVNEEHVEERKIRGLRVPLNLHLVIVRSELQK